MKVELGPLRREDLSALEALLVGTEVFRPEEVDVALEVAGSQVAETDDYRGVAARDGDALLGWACWGPTPCTRGTFDLYWIAVAAAAQGRGVGRLMMEHAEADQRARGGRLCVIETSSLPSYTKTRDFYLRLGYAEAARIRDFYQDGDDKVVLTRDVRRPR